MANEYVPLSQKYEFASFNTSDQWNEFKNHKFRYKPVDENSTVKDDSVHSCDIEIAKNESRIISCWKLKNYLYSMSGDYKETEAITKAIDIGYLKVHDLHYLDKPYCYAFSVANLVNNGLPFLSDYNSKPPTSLEDYVQSVIQFVGYASNQLSGAVALPDFFVYFDWFLRNQKSGNIHALFKQFIRAMNYESRGNQSAFTNLNLYDKDFLEYLFKNIIYPDGTMPVIESIQELQKCYIEWLVNETEKEIITFPIHTVNFHTCVQDDERKIIDTEFLDYISKKNCINGIFNIYTGDLTSMSSCCRLRSDTTKLPYQNSFGAGGISIGSHRVVTLNLPMIALEGEGLSFWKMLDLRLEQAIKILKAHRKIIKDNIDAGHGSLMPLYKHGFMDLNRQFSTVGFIGLYECCQILKKDDNYTLFAKEILDTINNRLNLETDAMYNLEQIPGESAAIDLYEKCNETFGYSNDNHILSNQYIPLTKDVSVLDRIKYQGLFDSMVGGGSVAHLNMVESLTAVQMKTLIEYAAKEGCIYFAFNMNLVKCNDCGNIHIGKVKNCPKCNSDRISNYTRVVGFITPVDRWINGRKEEYESRKFYNSDEIGICN